VCGTEVCTASLTTELVRHCQECLVHVQGGRCGGTAQRS
jgi:hypothetical protein